MWRNLSIAVAAALLIAAGVVHGLWTNRWSASPEVADFVARLERVPADIGDWHGTDLKLTAQELRVGRIDGYVHRRYENTRNHHAVTLIIVCGSAGPISVHTPEVCFQGAGKTAVTDPTSFTLAYGAGDDEANFRMMRFARDESANASELRVFWTWSDGGAWSAPDNPRAVFAGRRALFKMYVIHDSTDQNVNPSDSPGAEFLREFLPKLDAALELSP